MICCVVGGALVAALMKALRSARGRPGRVAHAVALGAASGVLLIGAILAALDPVGLVDPTSPLPARLALLLMPAGVAIAAIRRGAAAVLFRPEGAVLAGLAGFAGALTMEAVDLHLLGLHRYHGAVAWAAVHLPAVVFLAAGLVAGARLTPPEDRSPCAPGAGYDGTSGADAPAETRRAEPVGAGSD